MLTFKFLSHYAWNVNIVRIRLIHESWRSKSDSGVQILLGVKCNLFYHKIMRFIPFCFFSFCASFYYCFFLLFSFTFSPLLTSPFFLFHFFLAPYFFPPLLLTIPLLRLYLLSLPTSLSPQFPLLFSPFYFSLLLLLLTTSYFSIPPTTISPLLSPLPPSKKKERKKGQVLSIRKLHLVVRLLFWSVWTHLFIAITLRPIQPKSGSIC